MARVAKRERSTHETQVRVNINLDGSGKAAVETTIPFLNHMLELFARHGRFDLRLEARGDTHIDLHHTVEDIGLTLGEAATQALGDKAGICRYGSVTLPMDDALVTVAVDLGGRPYFVMRHQIVAPEDAIAQMLEDKVKGIDLELMRHFFESFAAAGKANLHIILHHGENLHHIIEAMFKALGRALDEASRLDERIAGQIPSTKGKL
jgi:imidazoleglycerol-phosphate dehydratase